MFLFNKALKRIDTQNLNWDHFWQKQELLNNLALCSLKMNDYEDALKGFNSALDFLEHNKDRVSKSRGHQFSSLEDNVFDAQINIQENVAQTYLELGQYSKALQISSRLIELGAGKPNEDNLLCNSRYYQLLAFVHLRDKPNAIHFYPQFNSKYLIIKGKSHADLMNYYDLKRRYFILLGNLDSIYIYDALFKTNYGFVFNQFKVDNLYKEYQDNKIASERASILQIGQLAKNKDKLNYYFLITIILILIANLIIFYLLIKNRRQQRSVVNLNKSLMDGNQKIKDINIQLTELVKLKEDFNHILAHDIRAPITNISSLNNLMRHSEGEELIVFQDLIDESCNKAFDVIKSVLDQSSTLNITLKEKQLVNIHSVLTYAIQTIQTIASKKQLTIVKTFSASSEMVYIDPIAIQRVIINLLTNAIKFSHNEEEIKISTELINSDTLLIVIQDYGIGIPPEMMPYLFDKNTVAGRKGTKSESSNGIGLAICKKIVELHNGKIYCKSIQSNGASFFVEIPING